MLISGEKRFVTLEPYRAPCCDMARVRELPDVDDVSSDAPVVAQARELLARYLAQVLELVGGQDDEVKVTEAPSELSYLIGMSLCCDEGNRQRLLDLNTVSERLTVGCEMLRAELTSLAEAESHPRR